MSASFPLAERVGRALGRTVVDEHPLGGGQVGSATALKLDDGTWVVGKTSPGTPLDVEAFMLRYLREHSALPVPEVLHAEPDLLVLERLPGSAGGVSRTAQAHAGRLLARLHGTHADRFGFERDTLMGPFRLPNPWSDDWPAFFAEHRLRYLCAVAQGTGRLPPGEADRVRRLAERTPTLLDHAPRPSLVHGDVWSGNVLWDGERVTGLLDPATHYADPETELAFIELFDTFGQPFFDAYQRVRPLTPGYREHRRDVYQVVPLLVHVALFGATYLAPLRERLARLDV